MLNVIIRSSPQHTIDKVHVSNISERATSPPRPLGQKKTSSVSRTTDDSDLMSMYKMFILEEQKRRTEEHESKL